MPNAHRLIVASSLLLASPAAARHAAPEANTQHKAKAAVSIANLVLAGANPDLSLTNVDDIYRATATSSN